MGDRTEDKRGEHYIPYCIQGSSQPAFRGPLRSDQHFDCSCGHRLIESFDPDAFLRVAIQCYNCGTISETPTLPAGEILPSRPVVLGSKRGYFLGSTVDAVLGVAVTCDQEFAKAQSSTAPRTTGHPDFVLSIDGIKQVEAQYDALIRGKFRSQQQSLKRYPVDDPSGILEFPFAWATDHLRQRLSTGQIDLLKSETATALGWIEAFRHVTSIWGHHPRFAATATTFAASFLHTVPQLIVAAHLWDAGNQVGLAVSSEKGTPSPDLYIRPRVGEIFHIEVKAPRRLQWNPKLNLPREDISKAVVTALENSRHQINSKRRGLLVISSSLMHPALPSELEFEIHRALKRIGRNRSGVAAVVSISPVSAGMTRVAAGIQFGTKYALRVTKNPHFAGDNPVAAVG